VLEALIAAGAVDFTGRTRKALTDAIDRAVERGQSAQRDKASGQSSLFGLLGGGPAKAATGAPAQIKEEVEGSEEWTEKDRLKLEKQALGFYITGHPLARYSDDLKRYVSHAIGNLAGLRPFEKVQVAGVVAAWRERPTKTGKRMGVATLEDFTGSVECVGFDEAVAKFGPLLSGDDPVLVKGKVRFKDSGGQNGEDTGEAAPAPEIQIEEVVPLAQVRAERATKVEIRVDAVLCDEEHLTRLAKMLKESPGNCAVALYVGVPGQFETRLAVKGAKVSPADDLLAAVDRLFGGGRHTAVR
jgi:DNA polymerase-3 subunit alpha